MTLVNTASAPSASVIAGRYVFAHYFVPYPISIDNKNASADYYQNNYLTPVIEGLGQPWQIDHRPYGGLLRDRPIPRPVKSSTNWKVEDLIVEVGQAKSVNIDGFAMDIMYDPKSTSWQAGQQLNLFKAASAVGNFKIMLMPDMTSFLLSGATYQKAASICYYYASAFPNVVYKEGGSVVVAPFAVERQAPSWWASFISYCSSNYGMSVALISQFNAIDVSAGSANYRGVSYGMSNWGNRNPAGNSTASSGTPIKRIAVIKNAGMKWMQPVSVQDERPNQHIYDEAQNLQNLRNTWTIAISGSANLIQIPTWNDYSENAHIAPSRDHGWAYTNIQKYYIQWFKTGVQPTISADSIYLTHRKHFYADTPTYPETSLMTLRPGSSPSRNTVEAMAFLTSPATIKITTGSTVTNFSASAGVNVFTTPLTTGNISASIVRSSSVILNVSTACAVTHTPYVQDLQYISAVASK